MATARILPAWLRARARVGDITSDAVDAATPDFSTDLASSALDGWTADSVDATDASSTDDVALEEDAAKRAPAPAKSPPSSTSVAVLKAIQTSLMKLGYDLGAAYGADGKMGPYTRAAITKFKREHGVVPVNGQVTAAFRTALSNAANAQTAAPTASASKLGTTVGWLVLGVGASIALVFAVKKWLPV